MVTVFLWAASCAQAASQQPRPSQPPPAREVDEDGEVERINVHLVSVPVSVTDRDGRFVAGLRAEDFLVTEGGREQAVAYFASTEQPFSVLLLMDTSGSTRLRLQDIQESAIAFVNQLRPQDRVLPVAFDNDAVALLPEWTGDRGRLAGAIRGARTGMFMGPNDVERKTDPSGKVVTVRHVNTRLYDAVHKTVAELRRLQGRKALILFTDGFDTSSNVADHKSTLAAAEELDALIYVVQYGPSVAPGGRSTVPAPSVVRNDVRGMPPGVIVSRPSVLGPTLASKQADAYLSGLAEKTGGRVYRADAPDRIAQAFTSIAEELRRMYSIGYHPTPLAKPGERREVKIKLRRGGGAVRARRAYVFRPL